MAFPLLWTRFQLFSKGVFLIMMILNSRSMDIVGEVGKTEMVLTSLNLSVTKDGHYLIELSVFGVDHHFEVERVDEAVSMWLMESEENMTLYEEDVGRSYQNRNSLASLVIQELGHKGEFEVAGVFGDGLVISPVKQPSDVLNATQYTDVNRIILCESCLKTGIHRITRNLANYSIKSDYSLVEADATKDYRLVRSGRSSPEDVFPEVLVVVDYDFFKKYGKDQAATKKYILSFWNAVNLRFTGLSSPSVSLSIAGILVAVSRSATPYLESNIFNQTVVNAGVALDAMGKHYYKPQQHLPIHDMIVVLTALNLCSGQCSHTRTAGYAYVGGACIRNRYLRKINSVAIVEDSGGFSGVVVAAHEIGHLLGANHDGSKALSYLGGPGASTCPWTDGYIMSDLRNSWRGLQWSECSLAQIRHFLSTRIARCMHNVPHREDIVLPGVGHLLEETLSLDQQCKKDKGTRACYKDKRVCVQLYCYDRVRKTCTAIRPAAEGSTCGESRICRDGRCVTKNFVLKELDTSPSFTISQVADKRIEVKENVNDKYNQNNPISAKQNKKLKMGKHLKRKQIQKLKTAKLLKSKQIGKFQPDIHLKRKNIKSSLLEKITQSPINRKTTTTKIKTSTSTQKTTPDTSTTKASVKIRRTTPLNKTANILRNTDQTITIATTARASTKSTTVLTSSTILTGSTRLTTKTTTKKTQAARETTKKPVTTSTIISRRKTTQGITNWTTTTIRIPLSTTTKPQKANKHKNHNHINMNKTSNNKHINPKEQSKKSTSSNNTGNRADLVLKVINQKQSSNGHKSPVAVDNVDTNTQKQCRDNMGLHGSMTCKMILTRYAIAYCAKPIIKKKCCFSYQLYCNKRRF